MLGFVNSARRAVCTSQFLPSRAVSKPLASCARQSARRIHVLRRLSPRILEATTSIPRLLTSTRPSLAYRAFQHLAPKPDSPPTATTAKSTPKNTSEEEAEPTAKEQRKSDWGIITKLLVNVWPKNDWKTRGTVLLGFALLISGKVCGLLTCGVYKCIIASQILNVQVPLIFKNVIDSLNVDITASSTVWVVVGSLVLGCACTQSSDLD